MLHSVILFLAASSIMGKTPSVPAQMPVKIEKAIVSEFSDNQTQNTPPIPDSDKQNDFGNTTDHSTLPSTDPEAPPADTTPDKTPEQPSKPAQPSKPVQPAKNNETTTFSLTIGSYTTKYNAGNRNRTTNLRVAAAAVNGTVIQPGHEFSLNQTVGERTQAKGYKDAKIIVNGQYVDGMGGGVCQISSTLFNAALDANMTITSRRNHSLKSSYVAAGRDATVAWGAVDFKFKNPYDKPVKIIAECKNGRVSMKIMAPSGVVKPKISIKVTFQNGIYKLTRYVNGKANYVTTSKYQ